MEKCFLILTAAVFCGVLGAHHEPQGSALSDVIGLFDVGSQEEMMPHQHDEAVQSLPVAEDVDVAPPAEVSPVQVIDPPAQVGSITQDPVNMDQGLQMTFNNPVPFEVPPLVLHEHEPLQVHRPAPAAAVAISPFFPSQPDEIVIIISDPEIITIFEDEDSNRIVFPRVIRRAPPSRGTFKSHANRGY